MFLSLEIQGVAVGLGRMNVESSTCEVLVGSQVGLFVHPFAHSTDFCWVPAECWLLCSAKRLGLEMKMFLASQALASSTDVEVMETRDGKEEWKLWGYSGREQQEKERKEGWGGFLETTYLQRRRKQKQERGVRGRRESGEHCWSWRWGEREASRLVRAEAHIGREGDMEPEMDKNLCFAFKSSCVTCRHAVSGEWQGQKPDCRGWRSQSRKQHVWACYGESYTASSQGAFTWL